jgi:RHS repeat-associated protein
MVAAAPILCALLATLQVPASTPGSGYGGSRVRGLAGLLLAASGLGDRLGQGPHWPSPFTYGETASGPSSQYNRRVFDPETGFHDYGARMYWPQIGRFISADTYGGNIGNPPSLNRYSYVHNNPYKYTDPTGHFAFAIPLLVILGILERTGKLQSDRTCRALAGQSWSSQC